MTEAVSQQTSANFAQRVIRLSFTCFKLSTKLNLIIKCSVRKPLFYRVANRKSVDRGVNRASPPRSTMIAIKIYDSQRGLI